MPLHHIHQQRFLATEVTIEDLQDASTKHIPEHPYSYLQKCLSKYHDLRRILGGRCRWSYTEKILYSHLDNIEESLLSNTSNGNDIRGNATLKLKPDRVAMQDASAQMALLQVH